MNLVKSTAAPKVKHLFNNRALPMDTQHNRQQGKTANLRELFLQQADKIETFIENSLRTRLETKSMSQIITNFLQSFFHIVCVIERKRSVLYHLF